MQSSLHISPRKHPYSWSGGTVSLVLAFRVLTACSASPTHQPGSTIRPRPSMSPVESAPLQLAFMPDPDHATVLVRVFRCTSLDCTSTAGIGGIPAMLIDGDRRFGLGQSDEQGIVPVHRIGPTTALAVRSALASEANVQVLRCVAGQSRQESRERHCSTAAPDHFKVTYHPVRSARVGVDVLVREGCSRCPVRRFVDVAVEISRASRPDSGVVARASAWTDHAGMARVSLDDAPDGLLYSPGRITATLNGGPQVHTEDREFQIAVRPARRLAA